MTIYINFLAVFIMSVVFGLVGFFLTLNKASQSQGGYFGGLDLVLFFISFLWFIPLIVCIGIAIGRFFR